MSVAGILASSLFSNAGSQIAQRPASGVNHPSGTPPTFAHLQQQLSGSGAGSTASGTSLSAQFTQLGQDLQSGNLTAAQNDFVRFKIALGNAPSSHPQLPSGGGSNGATGSSGISGQTGVGALAAAMQAYSSLQQNPINSALSASLSPSGATLAVDA